MHVSGSRKVGRKPAFTADDVVAAAIAEGIDRFTLSAVAERLGVVTAAIYRLFPSRDDLVIACLDVAGSTLAVPEPGALWREVLQLWADECWRVCDEFPGLSRLVYTFAPAPSRVEHVFAAYAAALAAQGKTRGQAMFALDFIGDSVFASHLSVESMREVDDQGESGLDRIRRVLGDGDTPLAPDDSWVDRGAIDTKIDFILTGLERHWPEI
ncbi:TetR/AcrR family transcriptional regulator [Gordonia iterans]|uniref:TetR/AcrR family transcriptional regulator n=1 Tax=Gordonia iterans TaxID=1004901 RepID=A0A2S0KCQ7_9ACTN|nr:TetR/AcrR family transcriptional regulator [Gordonia iterans]AVL99481.1 TetR/AcrR family transcriptional regulator [Gordonia iterans]